MFVFTDDVTGKDVMLSENQIVYIEPDNEHEGYMTIATTKKNFTVKAGDMSELLMSSIDKKLKIVEKSFKGKFGEDPEHQSNIIQRIMEMFE